MAILIYEYIIPDFISYIHDYICLSILAFKAIYAFQKVLYVIPISHLLANSSVYKASWIQKVSQ